MSITEKNTADVLSAQAKALLESATICDLTLPWGEGISMEFKAGVWDRYARSGFTFVSLTLGNDTNWINDTVPYISAVSATIERQPDKLLLVRTVEDIERAKREKKLALGLHLQGTNPFQGRLEMVEVYYALGIRSVILAYNQKNLVGDGCHERTDGGLSRFGLALIAEMNRAGMLIDCTHTGYRTTMEAMEASTSPCIFSHSLARGVVDHDRNIRDDQIRALAKSGGIIGVNGMGFFMSADNSATTEALCRHIDYYAELIGPQYISLGFDYIINGEEFRTFYEANRETMYPTGYPAWPWQYLPPETLGELTQALLRRGYAESDVRGILGENFLRVARKVWRQWPKVS